VSEQQHRTEAGVSKSSGVARHGIVKSQPPPVDQVMSKLSQPAASSNPTAVRSPRRHPSGMHVSPMLAQYAPQLEKPSLGPMHSLSAGAHSPELQQASFGQPYPPSASSAAQTLPGSPQLRGSPAPPDPELVPPFPAELPVPPVLAPARAAVPSPF
jgi:hypothetical protein